ncbi:MAG: citrate/2-methylcitrate synthase [Candidatus Promineifilaceae bacterium]|nr:citrate/2-methylcitrate synthase [Candidatus Promineifilaceae bacterium]
MSAPSKGLAGVVAADSALSHVDGNVGKLIYRGYDILDLGERARYEEVIYLLWNGDLPTTQQLETFKAALVAMRALPPALLETMRTIPREAHPMAVLRTVISGLGLIDPTADDVSLEGARKKALALTAVMPTAVAAWERIRRNEPPLAPRNDLGHAANFLYMLTGQEPSSEAVQALDAYLVLLADHGFNASTFAARVTTGTGADVYSAITSAVGTLKGAAHGGANQKAMEQFIDAAQRGEVEAWYREARQSGKRIMGIGHRVYKVEDPRATILRPLARRLAESSDQGQWFEIAQRLEKLARADEYFIERNLHANVDYYSAVVLYMLALPVDQFTCLFAISRIAGWTAHVLEQLDDNRLIRPRANYVGPTDRRFVPLMER